MNKKNIWNERFNDLEVFIKETGEKPTIKTNSRLYIWIKNNSLGRYKNSDRANKISRLFDKYGCRKIKRQSFNDSLNELNEFLKETGRKPTKKHNRKLYTWIKRNTTGYKNSKRAKKINNLLEKYNVKTK